MVGHLAHKYQLSAAVMETQLNKEELKSMTTGGWELISMVQVGGTVDTSVARAILDHQEPRQNLLRKVVMEELDHLGTLQVDLQVLLVRKYFFTTLYYDVRCFHYPVFCCQVFVRNHQEMEDPAKHSNGCGPTTNNLKNVVCLPMEDVREIETDFQARKHVKRLVLRLNIDKRILWAI